MSRSGRRLLWGLIALGTLGRLVVAFAFYGGSYDIRNFDLLAAAFSDDPYAIYEPLPGGGPFHLWAYPPGLLAWALPASWLGDAAGLPFHGLIQLPSIAADAVLAWLVQSFLAWRGRPEGERLAAAALVMFGPSFAYISGYHGQIDPIAMLPAVLALVLWTKSDSPSRAWQAGLLIGLAATIKVPPLIVVGALLPTARSWREAGTLVGCAIAVPLAALAPFLVNDFDTVADALSYSGLPGLGGLSLVAQPELAANWLLGEQRPLSGLSEALDDWGGLLLVAGLGAVLALLVRRRVPPPEAAAVLYLTVWVLGPGFAFQYVVWGLPFLLLAGRVREAAVLQGLLLAPMTLFYAGPYERSGPDEAYATLMIAAWAVWAVALAVVLTRVARRAAAAAP